MVSRLNPRQVEFNTIFLDCVDEGLSSLGEIPKQLLYSQLEQNFGLNKQALPTKLNDFSTALEEIFGAGANFIEIQIMKSLHSKIKCSFEWQEIADFKFSKYVTLIKLAFLLEEKEKASKLNQSKQDDETTNETIRDCAQTALDHG